MTEPEDTQHLCDACGSPIVGEHFTDEEVCGTGDGPGFLLCDGEECKARRPKSIRARRQFYTFQRAHNDQRHSYTADTRLAFHVEMGMLSEGETLVLGELLGMTTKQLAACSKDKVESLVREAHDEWVAGYVSSGWEIE